MENKIRRQVEYYFNDFNLMRDNFLKNEIKLSKESGSDGFVDLKIMLKFNRLAALTTDTDKILKSIENSKLVITNEAKTGIKRCPTRKIPVDDDNYRSDLKLRTCFGKGFPNNRAGDNPDVKEADLDEIYDYLEEELKLDVETISLRRNKDKKNQDTLGNFTGSVCDFFRSGKCFEIFRIGCEI